MSTRIETVGRPSELTKYMQPAKVDIARPLQFSSGNLLGVANATGLEQANLGMGKQVLSLDSLTRPAPAEQEVTLGVLADEVAFVGKQLMTILSDLRDVRESGQTVVPARPPPGLTDDSPTSPESVASPPPGLTLDSTPSLTDSGDDGVNELSSIGSGLHMAGNCRPCKWAFSEMGCAHGAQCSFCHFQHDWSDKHNRRPCKGKRTHYRKLLAKVAAARGQTVLDRDEPRIVRSALEEQFQSPAQPQYFPAHPVPNQMSLPELFKNFSEPVALNS
jgi:hypothetical protein